MHITSLSTQNGGLIKSGDYPSSITTDPSQVLILDDVRATERAPRIVWLEDGVIKSFPLTPDLKTKLTVLKGTIYQKLEDVGLSQYGQFVAITDDGSGRVIKLSSEGLKVTWEYSDSVS